MPKETKPFPDKIYLTEKVGLFSYHCGYYQNHTGEIEYTRSDILEKKPKSHWMTLQIKKHAEMTAELDAKIKEFKDVSKMRELLGIIEKVIDIRDNNRQDLVIPFEIANEWKERIKRIMENWV